MSDNAQNDTQAKKKTLSINDDDRLRYIGFDVGPQKIGEFFKSKLEEEKLVEHVHEKRQQHDVFRDTSNFREERISENERWTIVGACAIVILSFFLPFTPMIGGHVETRTEINIGAAEETAADVTAGEVGAAGATDVANDAAITEEAGTVPATEAGVEDAVEETAEEAEATAPAQPTSSTGGVTGFQELEVASVKTRVDKTPYSWSSLQLITGIGSYSGALFSSGIAVILSAILLGVFMLLTLAIPGYIIAQVFTLRGDPDTVALKLKDTLRLGWIPLLLFVALIALSMVGGSYGFDTSGAMKQLGESYSIASLLGLLKTGFYVALAGFLLAGAKSVEI